MRAALAEKQAEQARQAQDDDETAVMMLLF